MNPATSQPEQLRGEAFASNVNAFYYNPITMASEYCIPMEGLVNSVYNLYPSFYTDLRDVDDFLDSVAIIDAANDYTGRSSFYKNLLTFSVTMTNRNAGNPKVA